MGKSTAGNLLVKEGYSLIDTDDIARQIVQPDTPALCEIKSYFGNEIISAEGKLRRDDLAKIVFSDSAARSKLESILHPRIRAAWQAEIQNWRTQGKAVGFVVIPLLFETNAAVLFDAVVCVACSAATQLERLKSRGWNESQIAARISAQWPVEQKIGASDYVVWTETNLEVHAAQWKRIFTTTI